MTAPTWDFDREGNAHSVHGHFAALVNRADPGEVEPEDMSANRVWTWMLVDTADPDRGILDGNDMWTPVTRAQGIKDATASLTTHDQEDPA